MAIPLRKSRRGFSLIELVIVVVIIGIIAAIAIPKMSRGASGASEAALAADLQILRNALEMYQAEHNGQYPDANQVNSQLMGLTTSDGTVLSSNPGNGIITYGPYLKSIPSLPVGSTTRLTVLGPPGGTGVGWVYAVDAAGNGTVRANATGNDTSGTPYIDY
ncbi:MAG TPA: type II secretion system protein [Tepidisphaeraceae bacterium]|jgi:type II secretion system protein G|nr:type II secretion system protein [Tepidisphaeraceae bacterium]